MNNIRDILAERILVLDGSMGVMLQREHLPEEQVRGERFALHDVPLAGNNDILVLTNPELVSSVHRRYLEAGADIIETNSFNSQRISQREYHTENLVRELNLQAAGIARREADRMSALTPDRPRFVAGSVGPSAVSLSLPSDVDDPTFRSATFDELREAYEEQIVALIDGGVDFILMETVFDTLNAKATIRAYQNAISSAGKEIPLIISVTISGVSGRLLSGHTLEAFIASVAHANPIALGLNCSSGAAEMFPYVKRLSEISPFPTIVYPNAGLPDSLGHYSVTPEIFSAVMEKMASGGLLNICGGCCGTTPQHIALLDKTVSQYRPRVLPSSVRPAFLAGIEAFDSYGRFVNVGERCNVAGSRKFLRLIKDGNIVEAAEVARKQAKSGAMILDINMDDALINSKEEMVKFLRMLGADPVTAALPWMIDSSDFDVVKAAVENVPGKPIVNSISLKSGEDDFLGKAEFIRKSGAAVVVMAFDEDGQAVDFKRKIEICQRAYGLLTRKVGFDPSDIIFDANILTVATGIPEHDRYAIDYIRAVEWISSHLPGAKTSGGLSNLSFAFRGNDYIRRAMHSVFLHHAIPAGLSMAIMNPAENVLYSSIPGNLRNAIEDVILCRSKDAAQRLAAIAGEYSGGNEMPLSDGKSESRDAVTLLCDSLIRGDESGLENVISILLRSGHVASEIVDGPLMRGMAEVGKRFEAGEMFLPQVVKSARIMHKAVSLLTPYLGKTPQSGNKRGRWLLATVKGDVHDIGKNIAAVVLKCNNYEVIDLGVQVEPGMLVERAVELKPDFIGLSGLITPSLAEMRRAAEMLAAAGINTPLIVGGAATSEDHCALEMAPIYRGPVIRVADAARNPIVAALLSDDYDKFVGELEEKYAAIRESYSCKSATGLPRPAIDWHKEYELGNIAPVPKLSGKLILRNIPVRDVIPYINFTYLSNCWRVAPGSPQAESLIADAEKLLAEMSDADAVMYGMLGFFHACSHNDSIILSDGDGVRTIINTPRKKAGTEAAASVSLSDFVAPEGYDDHAGAFCVSIGSNIRDMIEQARNSADDYRLILLQSVCDRLVEAVSEWLHLQVRKNYWGYTDNEESKEDIRRGKYVGIRPAIGYPSLPDQLQMHKVNSILGFSSIDVDVTANGALSPSSSIAGLYLANPRARYF